MIDRRLQSDADFRCWFDEVKANTRDAVVVDLVTDRREQMTHGSHKVASDLVRRRREDAPI